MNMPVPAFPPLLEHWKSCFDEAVENQLWFKLFDIFFDFLWLWSFPAGLIVALYSGHSHKPSSHHQLWPRTRKFHFLRWVAKVQCRHQHAAFGQTWGSWRQIWLQCGTRPVVEQESSDMSQNQLLPPHKALECPDADSHGCAAESLQHSEALCSLKSSLPGLRHQVRFDWPWIMHAT